MNICASAFESLILCFWGDMKKLPLGRDQLEASFCAVTYVTESCVFRPKEGDCPGTSSNGELVERLGPWLTIRAPQPSRADSSVGLWYRGTVPCTR